MVNGMRVVSGALKGRALKSVPGKTTRPTTDKVKEAIFNMIGPYFEGGLALDLFAGSGSLGIEALSRGIECSIFIDNDMKAIQTIRENLENLKLNDCSEVYRTSADQALKAVSKRGLKFRIIFLDPPYKKQKLESILKVIHEQSLLSTDGVVVCEHSYEVTLPDQVLSLAKTKSERYGITSVSLYQNV